MIASQPQLKWFPVCKCAFSLVFSSAPCRYNTFLVVCGSAHGTSYTKRRKQSVVRHSVGWVFQIASWDLVYFRNLKNTDAYRIKRCRLLGKGHNIFSSSNFCVVTLVAQWLPGRVCFGSTGATWCSLCYSKAGAHWLLSCAFSSVWREHVPWHLACFAAGIILIWGFLIPHQIFSQFQCISFSWAGGIWFTAGGLITKYYQDLLKDFFFFWCACCTYLKINNWPLYF